MSSGLVWGITIGSFVIYGLVAYVFVYRVVRPFTQKVLIGLSILIITLATLHVVFVVGQDGSFTQWLFDLNREVTLGAFVSVALYMSISMVLLLVVWLSDSLPLPGRLYAGGLALVFTWLWIDEFFAIHEAFPLWRTWYMAFGFVLLAASVAVYWFLLRDRADLFVPLIVGLGLAGFAGVVLDVVTNDHLLTIGTWEIPWMMWLSCDVLIPIPCTQIGIFAYVEEFFELAGITLMLAGAVSFLEGENAARGPYYTRRALALSALVWALILLGTHWAVPTMRAAAGSTTDVSATYLDGGLTLEGYRINRPHITPGDTVTLTLYFQAERTLTRDYRLGVALLSPAGGEALFDTDYRLGQYRYPTSAWIPGFNVANRITLTIPEAVTPPASYNVIVNVWHEEAEVTLDETGLPQIGPSSVVLAALPVLSAQPPDGPPTAAEYRFGDGGLTLAGYRLPQAITTGETITPGFWWRTSSPVPYQLSQFVHVIQVDDPETYAVFDGPPFPGGTFPTSSWPGGMYERADWTITLPPDLPAGRYQVYTGLYTPDNGQRLPVTGGDGEAVPNNAIPLMEVEVQAP